MKTEAMAAQIARTSRGECGGARRRFLHACDRESRQGEIEMRAGEGRHGSGASKEGEARRERGEARSGVRGCPRRGRGAVAGGGRRN